MKIIKNWWCQKVLPLVYDDSLSYYEILCKLKAKINEIIEWINSHTNGDTFITKVDGTDLVNETYVDVYGRTQYNNYSAQGMCIIDINGYEYIVQCMIKDNSNQHIVIRNFETGEIWSQKDFTDLGHANSICSDGKYLYVATSGGEATVYNIVKLDYALNVLSTYTLGQNISPYGIAYNKGKFYILGANNTCWVTKDFINFDDTLFIPERENVIAQGLVADDNYLFVPRGNWWTNFSENNSCVNLVDVFTHDLIFVKSIYVIAFTELEEFDFLPNGSVLFVSNTIKSAVYLNANIYPSTINLRGDNNRYKNGLVTNSFNFPIYVDETTTKFRQDGTQEYPLSSFNMTANFAFFYARYIYIYLLSDITQTPDYSFLGNLTSRTRVFGNGHTMFTNIIVANGAKADFFDVTIKATSTISIDINFGCDSHFNNLTIDMSNSTTGIRMQGCSAQSEKLTFVNSSNDKINIYTNCNAQYRVLNGLTDDGGYYRFISPINTTFTDLTINNNALKLGSGDTVTNNFYQLINLPAISINDVVACGQYNITNCTDLPFVGAQVMIITRSSISSIKCVVIGGSPSTIAVRNVLVKEGGLPTKYDKWYVYTGTIKQ